MKNIKISYTTTLAEVPAEIDRLMSGVREKCVDLTKVVETVSFRESSRASLQTLQALRERIRSIEVTIMDCESLGLGLIELEDKLTASVGEGKTLVDSIEEVKENLNNLIPDPPGGSE